MNKKNSIFDDIRNIDKIGFDNFCRMRKKEIILIPLITIITLVTIVTLVITSNVTSEKDLISTVQNAINENDASKLANVSKFGGEDIKAKDLAPLMKYYEKNKDSAKEIGKVLETSKGVGPLNVKSKMFIFWETYYLDIDPVSIIVKSNTKGATLKINGKEVKSNERNSSLVPGLYEVEACLKSDVGVLERKEVVEVLLDEEIKMDLGVSKITISTNYKDAKVYVDGKNINKVADEIKNYGAFPNDESVIIYLEKDFPWGVIKSSEVPIGEESIIELPINPMNETLQKDITDLLTIFFTSTFESLNTGKKELIQNTYLEARDKIYDNLKKKSWILKNTYALDDMNIKINESDIKFEDDRYRAEIKVTVKYNVSKLFNLIKEEKSNDYNVKLIFYDGQWLVNDIEQL